ncbi:MAG: hypothetical protein H6Q12_35 [Bacteroidetes bacterium]|nr:hypothetical protein [Bacteroidota bacterium]
MRYEIEYLGGHPDRPNPSKIYLTVVKKNLNILLEGRGFLCLWEPILIDSEEIVSIDFEQKADRSLGKAATGAIIGGVLTGGVGLLVGGALGASKKDKSNLYITIDYDGRHFQVVLKTGKCTANIYSEICGLFNLKNL